MGGCLKIIFGVRSERQMSKRGVQVETGQRREGLRETDTCSHLIWFAVAGTEHNGSSHRAIITSLRCFFSSFVPSTADTRWHENGKRYPRRPPVTDNGAHIVENASPIFFVISTTDSQDVLTGSTIFPLWMVRLLDTVTATTILKTLRLATRTSHPRMVSQNPQAKTSLRPSGNLSTTLNSPAPELRMVAQHPLWIGSTATNTPVHGLITFTIPLLGKTSGNLPHFSTHLVYRCAKSIISSS